MRSDALIIAQSSYLEWQKLPLVAEEAHELADGLRKNGYTVACENLIDGGDKSAVEQALDNWFRSVPEDARVILFWTGHGSSDGGHYLVCRNTPRAGLSALNAIETSSLGPVIAKCKAEKILVILDTCYSGRGAAEIASEFAKVVAARRSLPGQERAIAVIASAHALERAQEGMLCNALRSVMFDPAARRSWSNEDEFIHSEFLARAVGRLLPADVNRIEYKADGIGQDFIPNPLYRPSLVAEIVEERTWRSDILEHFDLAARGIEVGERGWYFAGRKALLREIVEWLASAQRGVRVVTGPPGAGKSAVMGRLATLSDPDCRKIALKAGIIQPEDGATVPPERIVDVAIHAKGKTFDDCARALAQALGVSTGREVGIGIEALLTAIGDLRRRVSIIFDGLDEAAAGQGQAIAENLITPLGQLAQVRVLVGSRRSLDGVVIPVGEPRHDRLRAAFGADAVIDDLDDERDTSKDIAEYVRLRLSTSDRHRSNTAGIAAVAERVADKADGVFLYARIVSRTLQELDRLDGPLPTTALEAFANDLRARFGSEEQRVDDLLAALAWGEGKGLTRRVWPIITNVLARRASLYDDDDIAWALDHAGWHIIEAGEDGQAVYRLGHQALADNYRARGDIREIQGRIFTDLAAGFSGPIWFDADHYLWRHLADHAVQAGRLSSLLQDPGYLAVAEPTRLVALLTAAHDISSSAVADVYIRTVDRLIHLPPLERLPLIHLTAQMVAPDLAVTLEPPISGKWLSSWANVRRETLHRTVGTHESTVSCVALGAINERPVVISGCQDGSLHFWDARTGEEARKIFRTGTEGIARFSAAVIDGIDVLFSESEDDVLGLFAMQSGESLGRRIEKAFGTLSSTHLPGYDQLYVRQTATSTLVSKDLEGHASVWRTLMQCDDISTVLRDRKSRRSSGLANFVQGRSNSLSLASRQKAFTRPHAISVKKKLVVVGQSDGSISVHDAPTATLDPAGSDTFSLDDLGGGPEFLTVVRSGYNNASIHTWSERPRSPSISGGGKAITAILIDDDGLIFSGFADGTVGIWLAWNGQLVDQLPRQSFDAISLLRLGAIDGRTVLVSGSADGVVWAWDLRDKTFAFVIKCHTHQIVAAEIGEIADRSLLMTTDSSGVIRLWDTRTCLQVGEGVVWRPAKPDSMIYSRLGEKIIVVEASARKASYQVVDIRTRGLVDLVVKSAGAAAATSEFDYGNRTFEAVARDDATILLSDSQRNQPIGMPLVGHSAAIASLTSGFIDDRPVVVSGGRDRTVRIWYVSKELETYLSRHPIVNRVKRYQDALSERWQLQTRHTGAVNSVALGRGRRGWMALSGGSDRALHAWSAASGKPITRRRNFHYASIRSISTCLVGGKLMIASAGDDARVLVWDEHLDDVLKYIPKGLSGTEFEQVKSVLLRVIGGMPTVVTCGRIWSRGLDKGTIGLWDARDGYLKGFEVKNTVDTSVVAVGVVDEDQVIIGAGEDGMIRIWDYKTGTLIGRPGAEHRRPISALDFRRVKGRSTIVSGSVDGSIGIWDADVAGLTGATIVAHDGAVNSISLDRAAARNVVVSGSDDKTIRVTSLLSQKELLRIDFGSAVNSVDFDSDVGLLVGISSGVVLLNLDPLLDE